MIESEFEAICLNHGDDSSYKANDGKQRESSLYPNQPLELARSNNGDAWCKWSVENPLDKGQDTTFLAWLRPNHRNSNVEESTMPIKINECLNDGGKMYQLTPPSPGLCRESICSPDTQMDLNTSTEHGYIKRSISSLTIESLDYLTASETDVTSMPSTNIYNIDDSDETEPMQSIFQFHLMIRREIHAYEHGGRDIDLDKSTCSPLNEDWDWDIDHSTIASDTMSIDDNDIDERWENVLRTASILEDLFGEEEPSLFHPERDEQSQSKTFDEEEQSTYSSNTIYFDCLMEQDNQTPAPASYISTQVVSFWKRSNRRFTTTQKRNTTGLVGRKNTQKNTYPRYKYKCIMETVTKTCRKYTSLVNTISTAMKKAALTRRFSYPRRDVIKWIQNENRASCPWRLNMLYLKIQSVQESLRNLLVTCNKVGLLSKSCNYQWQYAFGIGLDWR